ncbi:hypothetical protein HYW94_02485 [Candidatus Uhrbacteria bacterium]|nr:hypothetical protein [Candidatus Uhrbacteria bacterium]
MILNLEDEDAELDFIRHRLPVEWRKITDPSDVKDIPVHHIKWKKLKKGQDPADFPKELIRIENGDCFLAVKVPSAYEGVREGDLMGMSLGGSGDYFAFAASNVGERIGAGVYRLPPAALKKIREDHGIFEEKKISGDDGEELDEIDSELEEDLADNDEEIDEGTAKKSKKANDPKDQDARLIAEMLAACETTGNRRGVFYLITADDRDMITMRVALRDRIEVMKECVKAEQRLQQYVVGRIFFGPEGEYPEGSIEQEMKDRKSSDVICRALRQEEAERAGTSRKTPAQDPFLPGTELRQRCGGCHRLSAHRRDRRHQPLPARGEIRVHDRRTRGTASRARRAHAGGRISRRSGAHQRSDHLGNLRV